MLQKDLFTELELTEIAKDKLMQILDEGIRQEMGFKEFCYEIGKGDPRAQSQVRDALHGNGKNFDMGWFLVVLRRCPRTAEKVLSIFCDIAGRELPGIKKALSPEEELQMIKARIRECNLGSVFEGLNPTERR